MKRFVFVLVLVMAFIVSGFSATISSDSIDGNTSLTGWVRSSTSYATYYTGSFKVGTAAVRVVYGHTAAKTFPTTGYTGITLSFKLAAYSLESGEYAVVQYNTGSGWVEAGRRSDTQDTGAYQSFSVTLPAAAANNANFQIRLYTYGNSSADYGYLDDIVITGTAQSGGSTPGGSPVVIFQDGFSSSTLNSAWSTFTSGNGRIQVSTSYAPNSSYHVLMDCYPSGVYSQNELILNKDLNNYENISVEYYYKEYGDENHSQDGLYIYNGSWIQVKSFNNGPGTYTKYTVDLSAYSGITKIKWQQYDNYAMSSDGICIDDVKVIGTPKSSGGPAVSTHMNGREIGAEVYSGGVAFRTWAPNASHVWVIGTFNGWNNTATPMASEGNGYWSVDVAGAAAGNEYKYRIENSGSGTGNPGGIFYRTDVAARDTVHSTGNGIVVDPSFSWAPFASPYFENYIIYQLHPGSFAGYNDGINMSGHGGGGRVAWFSDIESKLQYVKDLGFNAIELLPVQEFAMDSSWGYNPALYFAPESSYGTPAQLRHLVNEAHKKGLAVIFDVVYNHAGPGDNSLWEYDGNYNGDGGVYFEGGWMTDWGRGPAHWKTEVRNFFLENARMYLKEYNADGLRFDATTKIQWESLQHITYNLKMEFPSKYLSAEHLPSDPAVITSAGFHATWKSAAHHEFQRAANGSDPVNKLKSFIGWDGYPNSFNNVKYLLGSHDDVGDDHDGDAQDGNSNWDSRHRYFVELFGGRDNWYARAKTRLGWALNVAIPGTPMMFMGSECHMPGYWHEGYDANGDHRFNWTLAGDPTGMPMRYMVSDVNNIRWANPALRSDTLQYTHEDQGNKILAFKRWSGGNVILVVVNIGDGEWTGHSYGVSMGGESGQWQEIFNSQSAGYGGWDNSGNYLYDPWVQGDNKIYINIPKWSVLMFRKK